MSGTIKFRRLTIGSRRYNERTNVVLGDAIVEYRAFDVRAMVADVAASVQSEIISKALTFELVMDDTLPLELSGDETKIRQILMNLTHNAVKFTDNGSIRLLVSSSDRSETTLQLKFAVTDNGIGIGEDLDSINSLFLPFTQADSSITRRFGGTGLGLSICKGLVGAMHGQIGAFNNNCSQGATFWFQVPIGVDMRSEPSSEVIASETNIDDLSSLKN